jgi:predicted HicB family RNase H-like nuclease
VEFDDDMGVFNGRVMNTRDVIFFEGTSVDELNRGFKFSIDDYLAMCAEKGEEPGRPFSGRIPLE